MIEKNRGFGSASDKLSTKASVSISGVKSVYMAENNMYSDFEAKQHLGSVSKVLSWCAILGPNSI